MDSFWIKFIFGIPLFIFYCECQTDQKLPKISRALEYPAAWRPVAVTAPEHLISIASFDSANKNHIAQIAHHNAQILRQIKGPNSPITQYHNPFPLYHTAGGNAGKHYLVHTNNVYQTHPSGLQKQQLDNPQANLVTSSSNMAQTVLPHSNIKLNYITGKMPPFLDKPVDTTKFKFLNSIHSSTAKIPGLIKTGSIQPNYSPIYLTTTSRIPIIRDVTLTPSIYRSTQKPVPVPVNNQQSFVAMATRLKTPVVAPLSHPETISMPGRIITSFSQFLPSTIVRDSKSKPSGNVLSIPYDQSYSNSYTNQLQQNGPYSTKHNYPFPPSAISTSYNYQQQHYVPPTVNHSKNQQQAFNQPNQKQHHSHQIINQQLPQIPIHQQQQNVQHQYQNHYQQQQPQYQQQGNQHQQYQQQEKQQIQNHQQQLQQQQLQQQQLQQQQLQQQEKLQNQQDEIQHQHQTYQQQGDQKLQQHQQYEQQGNQQHQQHHQQGIQQYHQQQLDQQQLHNLNNHQQYEKQSHHLSNQQYPYQFQTTQLQQYQQHQQPSSSDHQEQLRQLYRQQQNQIDSVINSLNISNGNVDFKDDLSLVANTLLSSEKTTQKSNVYLPPLPSVPPSVLSPFFQQIQQQQQQKSSTTPDPFTPKDTQDFYLHSLIKTQDIDFKAIKDEFSHNLVPPPPLKHKDSSQFRDKPAQSVSIAALEEEHKKALDILNKYNIPAISPLQDANRFDYGSKSHTSTTEPAAFEFERNSIISTAFTTEKPNVFKNLNRLPESEYKQHKVMHPAYTGAKRPADVSSTNNPFFPTPMQYDHAITHSFFTIEDAVTLSPKLSGTKHIFPTNNIYEVEDILKKPKEEQITEVLTIKPTKPNSQTTKKSPSLAISTTMATTTTTSLPQTTSVEPSLSTRLRGKNKMRRRRPRPTGSVDSTDGRRRPQTSNEIQDQYNNKNQEERQSHHKEGDSNDAQRTRQGYRNRNRGRPYNESESIADKSIRTRKPLDNQQRRPIEADTKIYKTSAPAQVSPSLSVPEEESTTINFKENFFLSKYKPRERPRKPFTTQEPGQVSSAPSLPNQSEGDETILPTQYRTPYSPSQILNTYTFKPTFELPGTEGLPEENTIIISTKAAFNEIGKTVIPSEELDQPDILKTVYVDQKATEPIFSETSSEENKIEPIGEQTTFGEEATTSKSIVANNWEQRQRHKVKDKTALTSPSSTETTTLLTTRSTKASFTLDELSESNEVEDTLIPTPDIIRDYRLNSRFSTSSPAAKTTSEQPFIFSMAPTTMRPTRVNGIKKFDAKNRPRFSVKDYRHRTIVTSSTEATPASSSRESTTAANTRIRFPTRNRLLPDLRNRGTTSTTSTSSSTSLEDQFPSMTEMSIKSNEVIEASSTEISRKRFSPKERYSSRIKHSTTESPAPAITPRTQSTRRGSTRRFHSTSTTTNSPIEHPISRTPTIRNSSYPLRRPQTVSLRQRIQNNFKIGTREQAKSSENFESDVVIEDKSDDIQQITEGYHRHETAIMKIAKDDHSYRPYMHGKTTELNRYIKEKDLNGSPSEQSERVAELTIFGNNFNSVNTGGASRRVPGYFTLATDDPILPIEAFFPQVKKN